MATTFPPPITADRKHPAPRHVDGIHRLLTEDAATIERFGRELRGHRHRNNTTIVDISTRCNPPITVSQLRRIEEGYEPLDNTLINTVVDAYQFNLDNFAAEREPVRIGHDTIVVADTVTHFDPDDIDSLLASYVTAIQRARQVTPGSNMPLRRSDIDVLAAHCNLRPEAVVNRLGWMAGMSRGERDLLTGMVDAGVDDIRIPTRPHNHEDSSKRSPTCENPANTQGARRVLHGSVTDGTTPSTATPDNEPPGPCVQHDPNGGGM